MTQETALDKAAVMKKALMDCWVSTPGGFRRPSFVHLVRPNETVIKRGGVSQLVNLSTQAVVEAPADQVPPKNPAGEAGGWSAWATWNNQTGTAISILATTWVVPPPPSKQSGQLIYLFNGLQDADGLEILQPVLQWGDSGAGGGDFWSVASWHVDSKNHAFCTPSVAVNPGDVLTGVMTQVAVYNDGTNSYKCEFRGMAGTSLLAQGLVELTAAEQTLEAYGLTGQADYPATPFTAMTEIEIQIGGNPAPLAWTAYGMQNPLYGEHTTIVSNSTPGGEVDLFY